MEWEYKHNNNIKGYQEYDYINHVMIVDETNGQRIVMLGVKVEDMTPDVWKKTKDKDSGKTFRVLNKRGNNPFLVKVSYIYENETTKTLVGVPLYLSDSKEETYSSMYYDWEKHEV